jgi:hypothetical protein
MTAETECCEACRPVELAHPPYRFKHGWIPIGGAEDLVPAGKVRKGSYVRIRDKSYRVEANRKHFRAVPGMRTLDIVAPEDVGIRQRMIHRSAERDVLPVLRPPGGSPHPHAVTSEPAAAKPATAGAGHPLAGARAAHAAAHGLPPAAVRRNRVQWASQQYPGRNTTWANAPPLEPPKA